MGDTTDNQRIILRHHLLAEFINGGGFHAALNQTQMTCFPVMKYISLNDKTLQVLICGQCPGCNAPFVRNICNCCFCSEAIPIIKRRFPVINEMKPVLTTDHDVSAIVSSNQLSIQNIINLTESKTAFDIMKAMLDYNPDIDGTYKMLLLRGQNHERIEMASNTCWEEIIDRYNAIWIVDESFKIVDADGNVAVGRECLEGRFQLPQFIVDMHNFSCPCCHVV